VIVNEVQKPADVEINDEFAVKLGLENLDKLKDALKEQIANDNRGVTRTQLKRALLDELADLVSFDVPVSMADMEFDQIWGQLKSDMVREEQTENPDFKAEDLEEPDDATKDEYKAIALRRVRLGLLLSEIGDKNDVKVSQEEVTRAISEQARRYPGQEKEVFEFYQKDAQAMASIRAPLYEEKVVDFILEQAKITDKEISRDDLIKMIEEEDSDAPKKPAKKKTTAKKAAPKKAAPKKAAPKKKTAPKKAAAKKA
jgi:trigger factor